MANVKMKFSVEIDGEVIIQHEIEEQAEKTLLLFARA